MIKAAPGGEGGGGGGASCEHMQTVQIISTQNISEVQAHPKLSQDHPACRMRSTSAATLLPTMMLWQPGARARSSQDGGKLRRGAKEISLHSSFPHMRVMRRPT